MTIKTAACFSSGIIKVKNVDLFFPELAITNKKKRFMNAGVVVGWGFKSTAKKARDYAADNQLPYVALEDGFLRSIGLGVEGATPASLVIDSVGIYYDARQPSKLEQLILSADKLTGNQLIRARLCIDAIKANRLSKYNSAYSSTNNVTNHPPSQLSNQTYNQISPLTAIKSAKVVVIDQTQGDASVEGALANQQTFIDMLNAALSDHPAETIWVKVHPDVVSEKKQGFLYPLPIEDERIKLCVERVNPWDFLDSVTDLYTVSSLMGFEALMGEVKVHCFGLPFYAGWGLTIDQLACERRTEPRTLAQLFFAAYIQYARYVDPVINEPCEIEDVIHYFSEQLRPDGRVKEASLYNISWWKQRWISDFTASWADKISDSNERILVWGMPQLEGQKINAISRIEDGFIRSIGLGVHFNKPVSLVCDHSGIYFDASKPSDLETLLNNEAFTDWQLIRARKVIELLNALELTKYNVGHSFDSPLPNNQRIILVPGQVEQDASIRFGSPDIKTNSALLLTVRKHNPDAFIIYKPHPDVVVGQRDDGQWQGDYLTAADCVVDDCSMSSLLERVDEVHTMTSLTGFEALLRGKVVHTYGLPFYAGWGLTIDALYCARRQRIRSLEELVFATLVLYPTYVDPLSRQTCTVEQAIKRLHQLKQGDIQIKDTKLTLLLAAKSYKRQLKKWLGRG